MLKHLTSLFSTATQETATSKTQQTQLAVCVLLFEISATDGQVEAREVSALKDFLLSYYNLPTSELDSLYQNAVSQHHESTDLYQYTRLINDHFEYAEKLTILRGLWEVAFADNELDKYEESQIRKIADLLYIRHSDFIKQKALGIQAAPQEKY